METLYNMETPRIPSLKHGDQKMSKRGVLVFNTMIRVLREEVKNRKQKSFYVLKMYIFILVFAFQ